MKTSQAFAGDEQEQQLQEAAEYKFLQRAGGAVHGLVASLRRMDKEEQGDQCHQHQHQAHVFSSQEHCRLQSVTIHLRIQ
ncbi:MAG: hypothetical protein ACRD4F_15220 [Candidatus Angelobacter sp.]